MTSFMDEPCPFISRWCSCCKHAASFAYVKRLVVFLILTESFKAVMTSLFGCLIEKNIFSILEIDFQICFLSSFLYVHVSDNLKIGRSWLWMRTYFVTFLIEQSLPSLKWRIYSVSQVGTSWTCLWWFDFSDMLISTNPPAASINSIMWSKL